MRTKTNSKRKTPPISNNQALAPTHSQNISSPFYTLECFLWIFLDSPFGSIHAPYTRTLVQKPSDVDVGVCARFSWVSQRTNNIHVIVTRNIPALLKFYFSGCVNCAIVCQNFPRRCLFFRSRSYRSCMLFYVFLWYVCLIQQRFLGNVAELWDDIFCCYCCKFRAVLRLNSMFIFTKRNRFIASNLPIHLSSMHRGHMENSASNVIHIFEFLT